MRSLFYLLAATSILVESCAVDKVLDVPGGGGPAFYPPTEEGPCAYAVIDGPAVFPSYMSEVDDLTYRIPTSHARPPFPVIIVEPGFFSLSTELEDVQNRYASHGFLVVGVNNTSHFNLITTSLDPYARALLQAVRFVVESSRDSAGALYGLVDTAAIGISGHSMGGGGTIMACDSVTNAYHRYITSAIAMNPFGRCSGSGITVPILLIASELDSVMNPFMWGVSSSPEDVYWSFQSIPAGTTKLFADFRGMDHNGVVDANIFLPTSGNAPVFLPTKVSWFKVYLAHDADYQAFLDTTGSGYCSIKDRFAAKGDVPGYLYHSPAR